jgi:hypothetical protein
MDHTAPIHSHPPCTTTGVYLMGGFNHEFDKLSFAMLELYLVAMLEWVHAMLYRCSTASDQKRFVILTGEFRCDVRSAVSTAVMTIVLISAQQYSPPRSTRGAPKTVAR